MYHRSSFLTALLILLLSGFAAVPAVWAQGRVLPGEWTQLKASANAYLEAQAQAATHLKRLLPQMKAGEETTIELVGMNGEQPEYRTTLGMDAAVTIQAVHVWPGGGAGANLTGSGQVAGLWDGGGVRLTHQEFNTTGQRRVTQQDNPGNTSHHHATSVAGLINAGGVVSGATGIAYEAMIHAYDWNADLPEMMNAAEGGMLVSVHPYGNINGWGGSLTLNDITAPVWNGNMSISLDEDYRFGLYTVTSQYWDEMTYNAPYYLPIKSAGNDRGAGPGAGAEHYHYESGVGYVLSTDVHQQDGGSDGYDSLIGGAGVSKNVLTIGATALIPNGYQQPSDVQVSYFSAWGPTDDGRIKPDLVAPGENLHTTLAGSDVAYKTWATGTSFSAPVAVGAVSLMHEQFETLYPNAQHPMLASTVRALLYHSAFEAGSIGPDYQHGWGLLNVEGSIDLLQANSTTRGGGNIQELTLAQDDVLALTLTSVGEAPIRLTMAWTDPSGLPNGQVLNHRQQKLVNDLDIRIVGPNGQTYYPWVLSPDAPNAPAALGDNDRDNSEQVFIAAPVPGHYTVYLSHKGTLANGQQRVSLVVSGSTNTGFATDADADGLYSHFEDLNADGIQENDDTDQDGIPNYLDLDDDGDGIPTLAECADPNGDGNPEDACSTNAQGIPDYLYSPSLPVELVSFTAQIEGSTLTLWWRTATETDNAGFEIEVSRPINGESEAWERLGYVEGAGSTLEAQSYQYQLRGLQPGPYVFRLRQIDFDGTSTYSQTLHVSIDLPGLLEIGEAYPNPAQTKVRIPLSVNAYQVLAVNAFDIQGRAVATLFSGSIRKGETQEIGWDIPAGLPNGMYLIRFRGEAMDVTKKVIVNR